MLHSLVGTETSYKCEILLSTDADEEWYTRQGIPWLLCELLWSQWPS